MDGENVWSAPTGAAARPPDGVIEFGYTLDGERLAAAFKQREHWPVRGWRRLAVGFGASLLFPFALWVFLLVFSTVPVWEGLVAGAAVYIGELCIVLLLARYSAPTALDGLGVTSGSRVQLRFLPGRLDVLGVPALQRVPRSAVASWSSGDGLVCVVTNGLVLPIDLRDLPAETIRKVDQWLRATGPAGDAGVVERREDDIEVGVSRPMLALYSLGVRTRAYGSSGLAVAVVGLLFGDFASIFAAILGWMATLCLRIGWDLWKRGPTPTAVLSIMDEGIADRGPSGWGTVVWRHVEGVSRVPGLGWLVRLRGHRVLTIDSRAVGDVDAFLTTVRAHMRPSSPPGGR